MAATTIALYGRHGQKDVCFGRMLKQSASGVLASFRILNVPQRVRLRSFLAAALLDGLFEHPAGVFRT